MYSSSTVAVGLVAALAAPAAAFFRIPCPGRLIDERADPVIFPGVVSPHVHTIAGGNGFGFEMTYEQTQTSTCSSCPITQDLSNYWTPKLFYQYENGSFEMVPQVGDGNGVQAGMNVYYLQRGGPNNDALKAFPEGFRMVAGDPFKRNSTSDFASQAISFVCLDYSTTSPQTAGMPTTNCPDGLRAQVFFPSCWDGVNLDSADHKSHMAYPANDSYDNGPCPASHPVHLISLFFEVLYNTNDFADMWYGDGQPFVFAMGDPTGYGFHGDFINGWNVPVLQEAVNTCTNDSGLITDCDVFDFFTTEQSQACIIPPSIEETITGVLPALPGCNPVTDGPGEATAVTCSTPAVGPYTQYFTDVTGSLGYEYIGCGTDSVSSRTLSAARESLGTMDVKTCVSYCSGKGYTYAGLEYSSQCYCGNTLPTADAPTAGVLGNCFSTCSGNSSEYCGGANALSLYKKCASGSSCTNLVYTAPYDTSASSSSSAAVSSSTIKTSSSSATIKTSSTSTSTHSSSTSKSSSTTKTSSATTVSTSKASTTKASTATSSTKTSTSATSTLGAARKAHQHNNRWSHRQRAYIREAEKEHAIAEREEAAVKAKLASL
ncbi:hypothetical protein BDV97DRAFT_350297 [Delphinella strobiligena]|nr:hypothetical protein BDV97DRAFT_350297 [Delphinella strobiligena]